MTVLSSLNKTMTRNKTLLILFVTVLSTINVFFVRYLIGLRLPDHNEVLASRPKKVSSDILVMNIEDIHPIAHLETKMTLSESVLFVAVPLTYFTHLAEAILMTLVRCYDDYIYSPLQALLWPLVASVPRSAIVHGRRFDIFTANIVSWTRTLLVIPIAFSLKYKLFWCGFAMVLFHDFLDHLDGIVAKVQRHKYGQLDDPIVGGFMDAFCDKIVNVLSLWSILMVTDFSHMTEKQSIVFIGACSIIIGYEFVLGVVRVQDFFRAFYHREFKVIEPESSATSTASVMEGKLKEKLESMGIAALCVAQSNKVPLESVSGVVGVTCLLLSVRLAHSSLTNKLRARNLSTDNLQKNTSDDEDELNRKKYTAAAKIEAFSGDTPTQLQKPNIRNGAHSKCPQSGLGELEKEVPLQNQVNSKQNDKQPQTAPGLNRCLSMPGTQMLQDTSVDARVECVYTIGCFDLFHQGHVMLMRRMQSYGKKVIVGVHDSRSIYHLKHRVPIDSTLTRMRNVKQYANEVFCVAGTDPTPFLDFIFDRQNGKESAVYIRGDDMPEFPARHLCESLMTVKLLPYTQGVSSTKLRKDLLDSSCYDVPDGTGGVMFY